MKRVKRFLAAVLSMSMLLMMGMTVYAGSTTSITISGGTNGSEYSAYKLLDVDDKSDTDNVKIAYTVNDDYAEILKDVINELEDGNLDYKGQEIVTYISSLNVEEIRTFADAVYEQVKGLDADYVYTAEENQFVSVEPGYYLIVETSIGDSSDTFSLVMLDTAGNDSITITTKEDVPTLVKKVQETDDTAVTVTDWQDGADYDIGDTIPFKLTGTLPSTYAEFTTYFYSFQDTLSAGLDFNNDVVVKVDGTTIATGYEVVTAKVNNETTLEIRFADLKKIYDKAGNAVATTKDSVLTVEYSAMLNENAVIGSAGNPNIAKLVYSNNPYYDPTGTEPDTTSETITDKVIIFTYELDVNKVDKTGAALKGAGFTLYKLVDDKDDTTTDDYVAVGSEVSGADITTFVFKGLDAGWYKLVETTVPAGYNQAEDIEFIVTSAYDTEADAPAFQTLAITDKTGNALSGAADSIFTVTDGVMTTTVENLSGTILPSTGGIGTVIFYVVGAVIMVGAAALYIRGRRTKEK